ncbi:SH3 domain-containing protein C23A1.17-like isoform X2 [Macadamia integrifolia]|uniref:SH3 domain-containing protein C23A1.17-like isoform X2 n=1 Tax=Macadamia integrifolia TaxID=60698 RepID=UPI001C4F4722|nr:SH3 domain-containing protein C23A1.17-like isoform X2 [Macadamia integrifolia]
MQRALDERKGSSKTAIKKYIDSTYPNLPATHAALLTTHLKRLKNTGLVIMVRRSYKLPNPKKAQAAPPSSSSALAFPLSVPEKRGRGRPPKPKPLEVGPALPKRSRGRPPKPKPLNAGPALLKRRPGRPPKPKPASVTFTVVGSDVKRGRGRPPKPKPILVPGSNGIVSQPKPRRQPKKPRPIAVPTSYGFVPPKQPRKPPKVRPLVATAGAGIGFVSGSPRPRGRPPKNAVPSSSGDMGAGPSTSAAPIVVNKGGSRPRGRPPKKPKNVADVAVATVVVLPHAPVGESVATAVVSGGLSNNVVSSPEKRGRGRPRKTGGLLAPKDGPSTPKRPVGRPKKIIMTPTAATVATETVE